MTRSRRKALYVSVPVIVALIVGTVLYLNRERPYDPSFDARVTDPAYQGHGPVVLYDEGHLNVHTTSAGYKPFSDLIRSDGYDLRVTQRPVSTESLNGISVLVIVLARGANDANDDPAFSASETSIIAGWVREGGSLLLIADHWPYGSAVASLARRLDVQVGAGLVQDPEHHLPDRGDSHLVFSAENGLLRDHPIVRGRNPAERIQRVLTFTGVSILGPPAAVPFLALSDTATDRPPGAPYVEKSGGDIRVSMEYGDPVSARGGAQGIAFEAEKGRVVILGEAGMLRAQRESSGALVGMNVPGYDNRQLAINIMHWLSRLL